MTDVNPNFLEILRCPQSGQRLSLKDGNLATPNDEILYPITPEGLPLFSNVPQSEDSQKQQAHYDEISAVYLETLSYPQSQVYWGYLNDLLIEVIGEDSLGTLGEICCGRGEALTLLEGRFEKGVGIDISSNMLRAAMSGFNGSNVFFAQGDATVLPLAKESLDNVVMLGGIHHVKNREALFGEVFRVLKPGGRFIWREPVSDFFLWRWLRAVIYRLSSYLDHTTERPLLWKETVPVLETAGFKVKSWRTYGFFGFCLFVNSDVLIFNRLFRFIPGIETIVRFFAAMDHRITSFKALHHAGLQVIGVAQKPSE
jgi:ubiquinone/menaquinone biosynthesis C-methylase UbiE